MKKLNLIIGKKQIILACLTMMLGIAVYANYALSGGAGKLSAELGDELAEPVAGESYGDTKFVNAEELGALALSSEDYFAQARLEKMTSRDEAVQTLQTIMGGGDITEDEMVVKAMEAVELSNRTKSESTIESLIKANGFADCIVYLENDNAKIVVKTEGLETAQAAAIKDILLTEAKVPTENIRIFEVR